MKVSAIHQPRCHNFAGEHTGCRDGQRNSFNLSFCSAWGNGCDLGREGQPCVNTAISRSVWKSPGKREAIGPDPVKLPRVEGATYSLCGSRSCGRDLESVSATDLCRWQLLGLPNDSCEGCGELASTIALAVVLINLPSLQAPRQSL